MSPREQSEIETKRALAITLINAGVSPDEVLEKAIPLSEWILSYSQTTPCSTDDKE